MGGRILEYEAKDILRKGIAEGEAKGRAEGEAKGRAEGEAKGRAEGRAEGEAKGRAEGRNATFFELVRDGIVSSKDAAGRVNLSESAFVDQMNSYFKEVQVSI